MCYICVLTQISYMELQQIKEDKVVFQSNIITSARYDFTACQLDILFMILAMIEKDDDDEKLYSIYVKDIEDLTGRRWDYRQMYDATADMGSKMFVIFSPEKDVQMWLFRKVEHIKGKGYINVQINPDMRKVLFNVKKEFTAFQLKSALSCTSKYAKRLYTIACQWRSIGGKTYEIEEFKKMLSLDYQYSQIGQLKEKVLDVAKRQINENTDIEFDYSLVKRGRSFTKITLHVGSQKFKQLAIDFKEPVENQRELRIIMAYGIDEQTAKKILKHGIKKFEQAVEDTKTAIQNKVKKKEPVGSEQAYLMGVLKNKGLLR